MPEYIALLRGINVSGQKKILMKDLQKLFEDLGFTSVSTYIQSGNVLFDSKEKKTDKIIQKIKSSILKKYGFEVEIVLVNEKYLSSVISSNPFMKKKNFDEKRMYVSFLSEKPGKPGLDALSLVKSADDEWIFKDLQLYFYCPDGYGKTKFSNNLVESKLKITATTRNWNTINELLKLSASKK